VTSRPEQAEAIQSPVDEANDDQDQNRNTQRAMD
jgi:hypothetical protein